MGLSSARPTLPWLICVTALLGVAPALASQEAPRPSFEPDTLRLYDGTTVQAEMGKLTVPEDRGRATGVTISLAFLRLKTTSPTPASPIIFLMGGPGIPASVMAPIPPYWSLFDRLRATADVILLDQRGTGLSSPKLDCPPSATPPDSTLLSSRAALVAAYADVGSQCAAYWRGRGWNPRDFGMDASADDIDDVRRALGAPRVSLLAFSYGTRLALDFARRHPDRLDKLVLQGPETPDLRYRSPRELDSLFDRLADLAAVDSASAPISANLRGRLEHLLNAFARAPISVRVRSPRGDSLRIAVGRDGLQAIVADHLKDPRLPAFIATLDRGDTRLLTQWVEAVYLSVASGGTSLMGWAAECSAPVTESRAARVDREARGSLLGLPWDDAVVTRSFCASLGLAGQPWPDGALSQRAFNGPALILVGELDSQTPVTNAAVVARSLPGSVTLRVANGRHELLTYEVVQNAVAEFFAGRSVSGRRLRVGPPRFLSIEDALRPPRHPWE